MRWTVVQEVAIRKYKKKALENEARRKKENKEEQGTQKKEENEEGQRKMAWSGGP